MKQSNYKCACCKKILNVTDNMITATLTTDFINKTWQHETGKTNLIIHWCELCADGVNGLTIEKPNHEPTK